jgi:polyhydroxyalkanoate synthesis regulator phasin
MLEAGKYDVAVDIGPGYATQRKEAAESMIEILKAFPQAAQVMGDLLAKNFDWPEADEISKRLKLLLPVEVLQDENPAFRQAMMQKEQQIAALTQQSQALMTELQRMTVEMQNKMVDAKVKEGELRRKIAKDLMDHTVDMTDLELQASRDLNPYGVAY